MAYVGSSNISHSALNHGLEWNLKVTSSENQNAFQEICSKFKFSSKTHKLFTYLMSGSTYTEMNTSPKLLRTKSKVELKLKKNAFLRLNPTQFK